ncbi:hypothetical protein FIBSPDRAFT_843964 [Athelia psychrophila]|uniref:LigT-like protein n=1 Tax=Athelia psychrophila TaxID=1759441 RepID=A0A167UYY9_9AGAM|nr:hypothetical protein FIBSPDRAFT_843964 [Fibularhizoctonia sp. CBS 109695]
MPAPLLPAHLAHKSALVLIPPSPISTPIQSLRRVHDRNFNRWPPHVNLIYPFLCAPSSNIDAILARIRSALSQSSSHAVSSFTVRLDRSAHFQHSRDSSTIYLTASGHESEEGMRLTRVENLQKALQLEFSECDADTRPYVPHLSIGQVKRPKHVEALKVEVEATMKAFCPAGMEGFWGLDWLVDRVVVIEREGQHDPFRVVGEVLLYPERERATIDDKLTEFVEEDLRKP